MGEGQQHHPADDALPEGDPERRAAGKGRNPRQRKGQAPDGAEEQQDDPGKESLQKGSGEERHVVASMKRRSRRKRVNRTGRHPPYTADTAPEIRPPSRQERQGWSCARCGGAPDPRAAFGHAVTGRRPGRAALCAITDL